MVSILRRIGDLFQDKCIVDDREPMATFALPGVQGTFGVLAPKMIFWQATVLITLAVFVVVQVLVSIPIYFFIVKRRGTISSYLIGYGIILPSAFHFAYEMLEHLDIHNKDIKICASMLTTVVFCRCLEAMHNTSPPVVEASLSNYMVYYSTMVHYYWDEKTQKQAVVRPRDTVLQVIRVVVLYHILSILISVLMHYDFRLFNSPVELDSFSLSFDLLHPGHLANNYILGCLYLCVISFGLNVAAMGENLKGFATPPVFLNPLLNSESPSDFWGRKWNLTIHRNLKGGVYLPLRRYGVSATVASFITFCVSGLLHDFYTSLIFYKHKAHSMPEETGFSFKPTHSKMLAFFLCNWFGIMLERPVGRLLPKWVSKLPLPIKSTLVVLMTLPISHWFTSQWALGGYFSDKSLGYWRIVKLE